MFRINNIESSKSRMTRAAYSITMEEVQERLDKLNDKYGSNWTLNKDISPETYDDSYFVILENMLRREKGLEPITIQNLSPIYSNICMDDNCINEISVTSTSRSLENDPYPPLNTVYEGEYECYESFAAENYTDFASRFNYYLYSISYSYKYGRNSTLKFEKFANQTVYSIDNMPKNEVNAKLLPSEVEEIAKSYIVEYVDKSLTLESGISYNNLEPDDLEQVNFKYSYRFTINGTIFEALSSNNNRMTSLRTVNQN